MNEHAIERGRTGRAAVDGRAPARRWSGLAWRQYRLERKMFWRNPSAAFFNFMLPLIFLGFFGALLHDDKDVLQVIVPGIAGMAVMSTTFNALAFNITALRELGILKRIRGTPLPTSAYLAGIFGSAVTNTASQIVIISVAGSVLFGLDWPQNLLSLIFFVSLGVICFASLGVALSHAIPNFDAAPAYVNAAFLPLIFISGVFYDADDAPGAIKDAAQALPLKHLIDGLSGAMVHDEGVGHHWVAALVLAVWAAAGLTAAVRGFSWESRSALADLGHHEGAAAAAAAAALVADPDDPAAPEDDRAVRGAVEPGGHDRGRGRLRAAAPGERLADAAAPARGADAPERALAAQRDVAEVVVAGHVRGVPAGGAREPAVLGAAG